MFSSRGCTFQSWLRIFIRHRDRVSYIQNYRSKIRFQDPAMPGTAPEVAPLAHGFQYLSEVRLDELEPAIDLIREGALALDLPHEQWK